MLMATVEDGINMNANVQPEIQTNIVNTHRGWRFWVILGSLYVASLLSAIEATVISTVLSSIVADLSIGDDYPWVVNSYMLASLVVQPSKKDPRSLYQLSHLWYLNFVHAIPKQKALLTISSHAVYGQLTNLHGRRWITLSSLELLIFGSGICGGAFNGDMLIAGRALQGVGGGGINMPIDLIVCDLVPLRERPKFMGLVFILFAVGTSMGPFLGGVLVQGVSWRWVFYIDLPIGGVALAFLYNFFHMNYKRTTFKESIGRFDWFGSFLVATSAISVLFALTYGGARYPWSSWCVIMPLVLGVFGIIGFHAYETSTWVADSLLPPHLFNNRTLAIAFFASFMQVLLFAWVIYFWSVYFQAVLGSSTTRSGVQLLPTVAVMVPFAIIGGQFVEKTGRYKPVHIVSLAPTAIGMGTFALLKANSSMGMWVGLQILHVAGAGTIMTALLPAIQAGLTDEGNASSTAAFSYIRSYGAIWGITILVSIFNNQFDRHLHWISDPAVRDLFRGGEAYALGNKEFLSALPEPARAEVVQVFVQSLKITWIVGAAIAAAATLTTFGEKEVELRTELETDFGLKERGKDEQKVDTRVASVTY